MTAGIRLIHGIDSLGVGGAQVMMFELYKAIERKYPEIQQNIFLLTRKSIDEPFVQSYGMKYDIVETFMLTKTLLDLENAGEPVVFVYHKLLGSRTEFYRKAYENLPVVVMNHSYSEGLMYNKIKECDAVISVCRKMKQALKLYSPGLNYNVILNGIDGSPFEQIVPQSRTDSDKKCLISGRVNSFNRIKYSDRWVKWCCSIDLPVPLIHEYIGDGPYRKSAKKIIESYKGKTKNDIRLLGAVNEFKEKASIIKSWDIFLYEINRDEGVSIAILEALACGVPVICSNHHGNNEIIKDGVNGYTYSSHGELKEILTELALNRDILDDLRTSAKKNFDEELDIKHRIDAYIDLFKKARQNERPADKPKSRKSIGKNQKETLGQFSPKVIKKSDKPTKLKKSKKVENIKKQIKLKEREMQKELDSLSMKFTVLTSGHNNSKFIKDWAESIKIQTYRPLEVIYVNDASSDNTIHKLVELKKQFNELGIEFKVLSNEKRLFCGSSYHEGQKHVTGDFIGILDSDDMLEDGAIEYIVGKYMEYPDVTWIYTQFDVYTNRWIKRGKGISRPPQNGLSMLDMGRKRKHTYSHWRTYSHRFPKPQKLFQKGLKAAVDKFMGYRLEEFGDGAWVDKVCYRYRQGASSHCISNKEPTKRIWQQVVKEAYDRRKRYKLQAHSIKILEP